MSFLLLLLLLLYVIVYIYICISYTNSFLAIPVLSFQSSQASERLPEIFWKACLRHMLPALGILEDELEAV